MKTYKQIIIDNISIEMDEDSDPKDVSRVRMKITQANNPTNSLTTKQYGQIQNKTIHWNQPFEFRYLGQQKVIFQTYCEHEYGYHLQQLQVLFRGEYYFKKEMFFKLDSTHVYDPQGEKKGVLRWQVRVVTKEEQQIVEEKVEVSKPLVREDLIGLIKLYEVTFEVTNPIFNKKKYQHMQLKVKLGDDEWTNNQCNDFIWKFDEIKLEYVTQGSKTIEFKLVHQGRDLLQGTTACQNIEKLKRYIKHRVSMFNKNGIKLGILVVQYRYVEKQELLDLLYSPNCKINQAQRSKSTAELPNHPKTSSLKKIQTKHNSSFFHEQGQGQTTLSNRQQSLFLQSKIGYLMNHNSDILIPKANRFPDRKPNSPYISYIDPQKNSQFSPKSKRGWDMSKGSKLDFTRAYRHNPGVGTYKLPSIWSKY